MAKKLASKKDKRLLAESDIKELNLNKADFSSSWQGRLYIHDAENSLVAKNINLKEKGEYAIKVR